MAVDLSDFISDLRAEVSAPGVDQLPNSTDTQILDQLRNSYWEAVLDGIIVNYTESDGIVTPKTGTTDLPREMVQLVILYAGARIIQNLLRNTNTKFRAAAGPVEFETENSALLLKSIYENLAQKRTAILIALRDSEVVGTSVFDSLMIRENNFNNSYEYWSNS